MPGVGGRAGGTEVATVSHVGELVHCSVEGGVATITLDSPANRNALSRQLVSELHSALDRAEQPDVRAIVLTHTGPTFCAGADLKERSSTPADSTPMARAIERLGTSPAPTIAVVNGSVRAGGVGIMAACDLVVVATPVTFAFTEARIGVAPAIISVPILARCNWSKLAAPFLTGETFDAATAKDIGLVTHVTDDVVDTVDRLLAGVLAGAPGAVAATKRVLRQQQPSMADMQALSEVLFGSAEAAEGMRAFVEKRPPSWAARKDGA